MLICDNRHYTVTRHVLEDDPLGLLAATSCCAVLDFPDSVAVSDDNHWIAISNHDAHIVCCISDIVAVRGLGS